MRERILLVIVLAGLLAGSAFQLVVLSRIDARNGPVTEPIELAIKELPDVTSYSSTICCIVQTPAGPVEVESTIVTTCNEGESETDCWNRHLRHVSAALEDCTPCQGR